MGKTFLLIANLISKNHFKVFLSKNLNSLDLDNMYMSLKSFQVTQIIPRYRFLYLMGYILSQKICKIQCNVTVHQEESGSPITDYATFINPRESQSNPNHINMHH